MISGYGEEMSPQLDQFLQQNKEESPISVSAENLSQSSPALQIIMGSWPCCPLFHFWPDAQRNQWDYSKEKFPHRRQCCLRWLCPALPWQPHDSGCVIKSLFKEPKPKKTQLLISLLERGHDLSKMLFTTFHIS
jgi:hypothetical protein